MPPKRDRSYKGTREPELVKAKQEAFLAAYGECGSIRAACEAAEVGRSTTNQWRTQNTQNFREKFAIAQEMFREMLQDMAVGRVKDQKPNDNPVLLITLLNAHYPELYRRDSHTGDTQMKDLLNDWKKWVKQNNKPSKKDNEVTEAEQQKKNAIDEVEKILSRKKNDNS